MQIVTNDDSTEPSTIRCLHDCAHCGLNKVCLGKALMGGDLSGIRDLLERQYPVRAGKVLFRQGDAYHCLYIVKAGSFKLMHSQRDGQEQICQFVYPGQLLCLDDLDRTHHSTTATALEDSRVGEVKLARFLSRCREDSGIMIELVQCLSQLFRQQRERLHQQSHCDAITRVALWLIDHSAHLRRLDRDGRSFRLSMERRDLANYLGLTLETVSRTLGVLQADHCLVVKGRQIECRPRLFQRYGPSMETARSAG